MHKKPCEQFDKLQSKKTDNQNVKCFFTEVLGNPYRTFFLILSLYKICDNYHKKQLLILKKMLSQTKNNWNPLLNKRIKIYQQKNNEISTFFK